jgi:hypothetical protein
MSVASSRGSILARSAVLVLAFAGVHCAQDTSRLTPEQEGRFQQEGIVRRADNVVFRFTRASEGYRHAEFRENRVASIIVTRETVLIHKNQKVGIEITRRSRRYEVNRRGTRVLIHAGTGRSSEVWSFEPTDDADGWTRDIRTVIQDGSDRRPSG